MIVLDDLVFIGDNTGLESCLNQLTVNISYVSVFEYIRGVEDK